MRGEASARPEPRNLPAGGRRVPPRWYARTLPRARREVIVGAGHLANLERPEVFNTLLRDFLNDVAKFLPA